MSDEFDVQHLDEDEVQSIIDWAVSASGMILMMDASPVHKDATEGLTRLDQFLEAVQIIVANMPHVLEAAGTVILNETLQEVQRDEETVEQFVKELDEL